MVGQKLCLHGWEREAIGLEHLWKQLQENQAQIELATQGTEESSLRHKTEQGIHCSKSVLHWVFFGPNFTHHHFNPVLSLICGEIGINHQIFPITDQ